jgi:2'-5' RNA ligase
MKQPPALILTLQLDQASFAALNELRTAHFPPERNYLPAHVTIFHALPGNEEIAIGAQLSAVAAVTQAFTLEFSRVRFLGRGVAIDLQSLELLALRATLATSWSAWLSAQDRQRYRPHVTIQNKVAPAAARALFDQLSSSWRACLGRGDGLLLWRYLGGPWELCAAYPFHAAS